MNCTPETITLSCGAQQVSLGLKISARFRPADNDTRAVISQVSLKLQTYTTWLQLGAYRSKDEYKWLIPSKQCESDGCAANQKKNMLIRLLTDETQI